MSAEPRDRIYTISRDTTNSRDQVYLGIGEIRSTPEEDQLAPVPSDARDGPVRTVLEPAVSEECETAQSMWCCVASVPWTAKPSTRPCSAGSPSARRPSGRV